MSRHARRMPAWLAIFLLAIGVAGLRILAGDGAWASALSLGWGLACVALLGVGTSRYRERGRLAWGLFSVSVLCGTVSMALYPAGATDPALGAVRDVLDLGAYLFGAGGILVFTRAFGATDPDAWLDSAAVGLALSLLVFEFLLEHQEGTLVTGRGTPFALMVAAIDAAIFTIIARFVIRPITSPSLSLLGAVIAGALVVDVAYYGSIPFDRSLYEAMWLLAYGAWAAASLHPGSVELVAASRRRVRTGEEEARAAIIAIVIHAFGALALLVAFGHHMTEAPTENLALFVGFFAIQITIVATRAGRLVLRLRDDERRRRVAEAAMRASEERFRRLAEVAPVGIFVADAEGRIVFANESWSKVNGFAHEADTPGFEDAVHPEDRVAVTTAWRRTVTRGEPYHVEHRVVRGDGRTAWVQATAAPLVGEDGRAGGWVGTVADVTGLVDARTAAVERAAFIDALIEQAPVGIEVYDRDGRSSSANRAQRSVRRSLGGGAGAPVLDVRDDPLMLRLGQRDAILAAFAGHAAGDQRPVRADAAAPGAPEDERWVRLTWFPLLDHAGEVSAVISFLEDVSAAVRGDAERRAVEAKLQEAAKLEALGVLAGGIAHDFNNLLVAILGHASIARSQLGPDSTVDDDLASVEMAARRAADLARQMLAYSGRGTFQVGAVSVEGLLHEMADLLGRSIAKGAVLKEAFAPGLPLVQADATQLRQVALNLIVNASDALGDKPGTITLRTALVEVGEQDPDAAPGAVVIPGSYVLLDVSDTGRGMDAATVPRIFDPFFTTKATGRGLGLAATLGIVKGHGGFVRVRSVPGQGTTIGVLLRPAPAGVEPGREGPDAMSREPRAAAAPAPAPPGSVSGRVLIVDDEDSVRALGRRVLEREGYRVVEAADGPEGVAAFATDPASWSAVLLDLTLPTLDGMAVLEEVRRVRADVPVVICSGWAAEEVAARLASTPGTTVLEKPYAPVALVQAIRAGVDVATRGRGHLPDPDGGG